MQSLLPSTMRAHGSRLLLLVSLATLSAHGDGAIVATIGPESIGGGQLLERAQGLADFQLTELGVSWPEQRRRLLDDVLVPEALLMASARRARLADEPDMTWRKNELLAGVLLAVTSQATLASVQESDITAYYAAHQADYVAPRSIEIWRLLVSDASSARQLIERARTLDVSGWSQLVRESSLDVATRMRNGSLGFVHPDGQTERPEVRVSAQLFAAADTVTDGQLVPAPVAEGPHFAVVWRQRSRPAQTLKLEGVRESIRALLVEQRVAAESARLRDDLRRTRLSEYHPEFLDGLGSKELPVTPRSEPLGAAARSVDPKPQASERGLR